MIGTRPGSDFLGSPAGQVSHAFDFTDILGAPFVFSNRFSFVLSAFGEIVVFAFVDVVSFQTPPIAIFVDLAQNVSAENGRTLVVGWLVLAVLG